MNFSTEPSLLWQRKKVQSLPAQYIPNYRWFLRSPAKRRWLLLDFIACTEQQRCSLVEKGQKPLKNDRIWNKQVSFQESKSKAFSNYSRSHGSPPLPWNVHIQTLLIKFILFNLCSSNRNTATISSLSTYSKQGSIIRRLLSFEIFPSRKDSGKFVLIRFGLKPTKNKYRAWSFAAP